MAKVYGGKLNAISRGLKLHRADMKVLRKGVLHGIYSPRVHLFSEDNLVEKLQGDLTYTRDSGATYIDRNGVLKYSPSPFATNLLLWSEDFSNPVWDIINSATLTHGVTTDRPSLSATRISSAVAEGDKAYGVSQSPASIVISDSYMFSVWLRGSKDGLRVRLGQNNSQYAMTVTSEWERYSLPFVADNTSMSIQYISDGDVSEYLDIDMAQVEHNVPVANGYVKTEATSVSGKTNMPVNASRQEKEGWLIEGGSTNLLTNSADFKSIGVGVRGLSLSLETVDNPLGGQVTKVAEDAVTSGHYLESKIVSGTYPSGSVYTTAFIIKPDPLYFGSDEILSLAVYNWDNTSDSGACWFKFDANGECFVDLVKTSTNRGVEKLANGFYKIWCSHVLSESSTRIRGRLACIRQGSTVYLGETSRYFYACAHQLESLPFASSYIPTEDSPVTRLGDTVEFQGAGNVPLLDTDNSYVFNVSPVGFTGGTPAILSTMLDTGANAFQRGFTFFGGDATSVPNYYGGSQKPSSFADESLGTVSSVVNIADDNLYAYTDGTLSNTLDLSTTSLLGNVADKVTFNQTGSGSIIRSAFHLQDFRIYDFALNEAEIKFLAGE